MRAAVFYGKHDLRIEEVKLPDVKEKDVLIKVMACGVCGTDVHIYDGDEGAAKTPPQTVLGHEFAGIVEAVGENVTAIKAGDRVCVDPNKLCGSCYYCKSGIGHFCEHMRGIGTTENGGFSQYCVVPDSQVYPIGDSTTFEQAAMAEPVACCLHGIDMCHIGPGITVMVIGGGMIGLLMVQLAKLAGAHKIILQEPVAGKRNLGRKLGADLCVDPTSEDLNEVLKQNGITRIQAVIECAGLPGTIKQAIEAAGKKSVVMMFGLTRPDQEITIRPFDIFKKEVEIKASFINPYTQARAVELIDSGKIDVTSMVNPAVALGELPAILASEELRKKGKFIITPWPVTE